MDVIYDFYYIHGPVEYYNKPSDFCCFKRVIEQWALTVIKLLRFFVLIFGVFLPDFIFLYHNGTVIQVSSKCGCFWSLHTIKPERIHCAVSSNDQIPRKQFCSRGVTWTRPPKSSPYRSHHKSYSISNIGNMTGCDHPSCVPVSPLAGELWHFDYFPTTTVRHFEF